MTRTERSTARSTDPTPRRRPVVVGLLVLALLAATMSLPTVVRDDSADAALNTPIRIMPVGDSITSGRAGFPLEAPTYRAPLYDKVTSAGFNVDFVGSEAGIDNFPNNTADARLNDPNHEGHNGWHLDELINGNPLQPAQGKIADWMAAQQPDIVILYAGANDFNGTNGTFENASRVYSEFVDAIAAFRSVKPDVRIVITNHHPVRNNPARNVLIDDLNPWIARLEGHSTPSSPVVTVDIHTDYPTSADDNGSHPGPNGQEFFAERIFRVLLNSGLLSDNTAAPSVNNTLVAANRGARSVDIVLTGSNIYANFAADLGAGVTVTGRKWDNRPSANSRVTVTVDVETWAEPGLRSITITNPDGDSTVCSNCFRVRSQQNHPPLRIMLLGGETTSGRQWFPAEEPTYRGSLYNLLNAGSTPFDFVGSQSGVDSGDLQSLPLSELGDQDHEGHREFSINELLNGKAGEANQGNLAQWLDAAQPDVVVLFAGQQDVAFDNRQPLAVMNDLKLVIERLRAHNPNIRIVVTNLNPHRNATDINNRISAYNAFFGANASSIFSSTASSPLATANVSNLNTGPGGDINASTYPNSSGNTKIATAIFNALSSNGMLTSVPQPPGPPQAPTISGGIGEITVTWAAPPAPTYGNTPAISGYRVTLSPGGETRDLPAGTTSTTFTNLSSTVNYTVSVTANNSAGTGLTTQATGSPDGSFETDGYWMVEADGTVHAFGDASHHGQPQGQLAAGVTAIAITGHPEGGGYWVLASDGTVFAYGKAALYAEAGAQSAAVLSPGETVTSIAAHPSGLGYWVFTSIGRAINYGNAGHFQDLVSLGVIPNDPVVASAPTADGQGYLMVGADGGVFAFPTSDNTLFRGSIQSVINDDLGLSIRAIDWLASPIVGIVPTPAGDGYWMIAADGGVFGFNAPFRGSVPGAIGGAPALPVNGMVPFGGSGYIAVGGDGGLFAFCSTDCYLGSLPDANVGPFKQTTSVVGVTASYGLVG